MVSSFHPKHTFFVPLPVLVKVFARVIEALIQTLFSVIQVASCLASVVVAISANQKAIAKVFARVIEAPIQTLFSAIQVTS